MALSVVWWSGSALASQWKPSASRRPFAIGDFRIPVVSGRPSGATNVATPPENSPTTIRCCDIENPRSDRRTIPHDTRVGGNGRVLAQSRPPARPASVRQLPRVKQTLGTPRGSGEEGPPDH